MTSFLRLTHVLNLTYYIKIICNVSEKIFNTKVYKYHMQNYNFDNTLINGEHSFELIGILFEKTELSSYGKVFERFKP